MKKTKKKRNAPSIESALTDSAQRNALIRLQDDVENVAFWAKTSFLKLKERESAAWLGAMRAVKSYDPSKGASLKTWTQLKAKYAIEDEERRERRQRRRFGKNIGVNWNAPQKKLDDEDDYSKARRERARVLVRSALDALDDRSREIIERVWYCGETQAQIARSFGFSQSWCSRLYRRGMAQIKEKLSDAIEATKEQISK